MGDPTVFGGDVLGTAWFLDKRVRRIALFRPDGWIFSFHRLVPGQGASVFFTKMARLGQIPARKVRQWLQSGYSRTSNNLKTSLFRRGGGI
jgi:hypothetical protein